MGRRILITGVSGYWGTELARRLERSPGEDLLGHRPPCDEIADLLGRYPQQRVWTAGLECAPRRPAVGG